MSRIGNRKIVIPAGVTVEEENGIVKVKGPKGELTTTLVNGISCKVEGENDNYKPMHGTINANLRNMIVGVTEGFKKELEIIGVGYRFALKGNTIVISAGYSHPVEMQIPEGIKVECPSNTELTITGFNKELVGEFAANVRKVRQPEPYKGKGIRYKDEHIIRKEGKKAA